VAQSTIDSNLGTIQLTLFLAHVGLRLTTKWVCFFRPSKDLIECPVRDTAIVWQ